MPARGVRAGRAYVEVGTADEKLVRGLNKSRARLRAFGAQVTKLGTQLVRVAAVAAAPFALSTKVFATFESRMARVLALTRATREEFDALSARAQDLGRSTIFSASQAAEAMSFFALAGFKVKTIMDAVGPTLDLAAAGQIEIAQAADITTKIMAGMGITTAELGHAVDVMAKAITTANTDVTMLGDAMKFVGPLAKSQGIAFEELTAAIQLLSNAGIQGEMAGTSLRTSLLSLTSPSSEARREFRALGIEIGDTSGNMRTLANIVGQFEQALAGMGTVQRADILGRIFPNRAVTAIIELIGQSSKRLAQFTENLRDAGGSAERIARIQLDTLAGSFTILKSAAQGLGIVIGDALKGPLRAVADLATSWANAIARVASEHKGAIRTIVTVIASVGAFGAALIALGTSIKVVAFAIGGIAMAIKVFVVLKTAVMAFTAATVIGTTAIHAMNAAMVAQIAIFSVHVILAMVAALLVLQHTLAQLTRVTAKTSDAMTKLANESRETNRQLRTSARRLNDLANKPVLSEEQFKEALRLNDELEEKLGNTGLAFDTLNKQVDQSASAYKRLKKAIVELQAANVVKAIAEQKGNLRELNKEIAGVADSVGLFNFGGELRAVEIRREAVADEIFKLQAELKALSGGPDGGGSGGDDPESSAAIDAEADASINAQRRVAMLRHEMLEDEQERALALIRERYAQEITDAGRNLSEIASLEKAQELEEDQITAEFAQKRRREQMDIEHELAILKADLIEDGYKREVALIEENHRHAMALAKEAGDAGQESLANDRRAIQRVVAARREAARLAGEHANVQFANQRRTESIEELRLRTMHEGVELQRELLDLEEQRALIAAKAAGESLKLIQEEFDLRRGLLDVGESTTSRLSSIGTFNPFELRGLGAGTATDRIARNTATMSHTLTSLNNKAAQGKLVFTGSV